MRYLILTLILCFTHLTFANPAVFNKAAGGVVAIYGEESLGSGAVVSKNGHIITNWHVLEGQKNIEVFFANDKYFDNPKKIRILKHDKERDLALIQLVHAPRNIQYISISKKLPKVGAEVHAIGHPDGELWSYTKGYVSAHRKNYSAYMSEESNSEGSASSFKGDVFQMQTPIYSGNSGGPLLNNHGNLIGINTFFNIENPAMSFAVTNTEIIRFLLD